MKKNYIIDTIKNIFLKHSYGEIQTPAMENKQFLDGNYGEDGVKMIYNTRNRLKKSLGEFVGPNFYTLKYQILDTIKNK